MSLLLRVSTGTFLFAVLIASFSFAHKDEPSEADMRVAVARWFGEVHKASLFIAAQCFELDTNGVAWEKLCSRLVNVHLGPVEVRLFRKIACRPSNQADQFLCSFTAHFRSPNPQANLSEWPQQGLFENQMGRWRFVDTSASARQIGELSL